MLCNFVLLLPIYIHTYMYTELHYATGVRHNMWVIYLLGRGLSYLSSFSEINVIAQKKFV